MTLGPLRTFLIKEAFLIILVRINPLNKIEKNQIKSPSKNKIIKIAILLGLLWLLLF
jgi:hypothetical protein